MLWYTYIHRCDENPKKPKKMKNPKKHFLRNRRTKETEETVSSEPKNRRTRRKIFFWTKETEEIFSSEPNNHSFPWGRVPGQLFWEEIAFLRYREPFIWMFHTLGPVRFVVVTCSKPETMFQTWDHFPSMRSCSKHGTMFQNVSKWDHNSSLRWDHCHVPKIVLLMSQGYD